MFVTESVTKLWSCEETIRFLDLVKKSYAQIKDKSTAKSKVCDVNSLSSYAMFKYSDKFQFSLHFQ